MEKYKVITEKVYSPVDDSNIAKNIRNSKVWDLCFKEEEVTTEVLNKHTKMFIYTIKFNGIEPFHVTKIKQLK